MEKIVIISKDEFADPRRDCFVDVFIDEPPIRLQVEYKERRLLSASEAERIQIILEDIFDIGLT